MRLTRFLSTAATISALAMLAGGALAQSQPTSAERSAEIEKVVRDYLAQHPEDIQRIVKDYLVKNPNVLQEQIVELQKLRQANANADKSQAIKVHEALLFSSPRQVVLGNRDGDVTLVEFFDYNCGYCKRALPDMQTLIKDDPKLKFVLKELPILGPGSVEAARVAVAVRMQDAGGEKYLAFHQNMMNARGQANKEVALAAAQAAGLNLAQLETDMASAEVDKTLEESSTLARLLGINGTPGYVVGDGVISGAIGAEGLKEKIQSIRARRPS